MEKSHPSREPLLSRLPIGTTNMQYVDIVIDVIRGMKWINLLQVTEFILLFTRARDNKYSQKRILGCIESVADCLEQHIHHSQKISQAPPALGKTSPLPPPPGNTQCNIQSLDASLPQLPQENLPMLWPTEVSDDLPMWCLLTSKISMGLANWLNWSYVPSCVLTTVGNWQCWSKEMRLDSWL